MKKASKAWKGMTEADKKRTTWLKHVKKFL